MDSRSAAARPAHPDAIEFVRFCYRRKHVGWPELYDEMCAVANRSMFRGFDVDALAGIGIGLCLSDMPGLAAIVAQVVADEQQARRAVAVRIVTDDERDEAAVEHQEEPSGGMRPRLVPIPVSA
jgi:hypothetical protein